MDKSSYASESANIDVVKQVISEQVGIPIDQIDKDKSLSQQNVPADALECCEIIMALEERMRITIPDGLIEEVIGPYEPEPGLGPSKRNSIADKLTVTKLVKNLELATRQ